MHHVRAILWSVGLLVTALVSTGRGDFCYAWTEYSLEWITDAASAIALGEVTACTEDGRFEARVDTVLKECEGLDLDEGGTVGGPCLGRSVYGEHGWAGASGSRLMVAASGLGMPVYSEPSTYPGSGRAFPPRPLPVLRRKKSWGQGDRVVLFFGPDVRQIIQIVNLDRPVGADVAEYVLWLAADLHGKRISDPDDLIGRVQARVAEGRRSTPDGSPKVCSHGFYYWASQSELDGHHYYFIFAPPDPCFRETLADALGPELVHYAAHGGELGVQPPPLHPVPSLREKTEMLMAIWYWFYSGRTPQQYAGDLQRDFDRTLRYFRSHYQRQPRQMSAVRRHCRNYPGGWQCAISDSGRYFAYLDARCVDLYDLSTERPQALRPLYRAETVDGRASQLTFSPGSGYFAYSDADGGVAVCDLPGRRVLWKAPFPLDDPGPVECTQLCFSPDAKYLVQAVARATWRTPSRSIRREPKVVYGWDVAAGKRVFAPYGTWQQRLNIEGFHEEAPRLVRLSNPEDDRSWGRSSADLVWDLETGRPVAHVLKSHEWEWCPRPAF